MIISFGGLALVVYSYEIEKIQKVNFVTDAQFEDCCIKLLLLSISQNMREGLYLAHKTALLCLGVS
jgi:hypothetical protein